MAYLGPNTATINDNLSEVNSSLSAVAEGIVNNLMARSVTVQQQNQQLPSELDSVQLCQTTTTTNGVDQMVNQKQQHQLDCNNANGSNLCATNASANELVNDEYVLFS